MLSLMVELVTNQINILQTMLVSGQGRLVTLQMSVSRQI